MYKAVHQLNDIDKALIFLYLVDKGYKENYYIQEFMDTQTNIGNLVAPKNTFDRNKLLKDLNIIYR